MIDLLSFFFLAVLFFLVLFGLTFMYKLFKLIMTKTSDKKEENRQTKANSKDDTQGDGLVLFDDPLFPEETVEDE
jgi:hypothetical protein